MSHTEVIDRFRQGEPITNLIFITSPNYPFRKEGAKELTKEVENCLVLLFEDLDKPIPPQEDKYIIPNKQDVEQALNFAKNCKGDIVVSCDAGVSRSSAIAFLISVQQSGVQEALKILIPSYHWPNGLIIKLGSEILNIPEISTEIGRWKMMATRTVSTIF